MVSIYAKYYAVFSGLALTKAQNRFLILLIKLKSFSNFGKTQNNYVIDEQKHKINNFMNYF